MTWMSGLEQYTLFFFLTLTGQPSTGPSQTPHTEFRGFLIVSVASRWYDAVEYSPMGRFMIDPSDREIKYATGCSEMITHNNFESKKRISFYWQAPKIGSGCIAFKAIVLQTDTLWFQDDGGLTKILCESDELVSKSNSVIPECCACGEAKYSFNFKGTWTRERHAKEWPSNEALIHWSNIIGATHSINYTVWDYGQLASPGLKELAEFGIIRTLETELKNHSNFGTIRNVFTANGLWFPNADKETSATFTVSSQHPLISFATMFGPSPDWLAGVSKLSLCRSDCTWIDTIVQDLFPIDAGTDSGTSYNSPNKPSVPQEKIHRILSTSPTHSPFYDPSGKSILPMAQLTIKRQMLRGVQCPNGIRQASESSGASMSAREFDPFDLSDPIRRNELINSQTVQKTRSKSSSSAKMKLIDNSDSRCMTTEWSSWSACSAKCGNGVRKRSRQYKEPTRAREAACNELIEDAEICLSENGECETNDQIEDSSTNECLMLTRWSEWSPCSVSCGKGYTLRTRQYYKPGSETRCNASLVERKECMVTEKCQDISLMSLTERKRVCSLEKKPGPCRMTVDNTKYYFDRTARRCLPFQYGGCRGNENRFESFETCEQVCGFMRIPDTKSTQSGRQDKLTEQQINSKKKVCMLPVEEGNCQESEPRFYFDRTKLTCLPFEYSGCGGNPNNFASLGQCQSECHPIISVVSEAEKNSMKGKKLTIPEKKRICMSPTERGTCSESVKRYAYSVTMAKCLPFDFSGCEGNLNNFESIEECESTCDVLIQMSRQASIQEEQASMEAKKTNMCMQAKERGPCMAYHEKYYFNSYTAKCEKFIYGGCDGNDNRFDSLDECEHTCHSLIKSAQEQAAQNQASFSQYKETFHDKSKICRLPLNDGTCNLHLKRYFYNSFSTKCEYFVYTGCGGNENNFLTLKECMSTCGDLTRNFTAEAMLVANRSNSEMMMFPIDCILSEWTEWSMCSASRCGDRGEEYRNRSIISEGKYGGVQCPSKLSETRVCTKTCSRGVDCQVGEWSSWSECKRGKSCNDSYQERRRQITRQPAYGGQSCPILIETRKCYLNFCTKLIF